MFVIFEHGGKQYKVTKGDVVKVEKIDEVKDKNVFFKKILFIENEKKESLIGTPLVDGYVVKASLLDVIKDKKVLIFKKKRRHNYRRKLGHRQTVAVVKIIDVIPASDISKSNKADVKTKNNKDLKKDSTKVLKQKTDVSDVKKIDKV